jgi:hypothetical protein
VAVGAIVMVLNRLLARHGVKTGIRIAQRLGFDNKSIKKAFNTINAEQRKIGLKEFKRRPKRSTFKQRKAERQWREEQGRTDDRYIPSPPHRQLGEGPNMKEWKSMWRRDPSDRRYWQTGQTGPEHPIYGIPGIDF